MRAFQKGGKRRGGILMDNLFSGDEADEFADPVFETETEESGDAAPAERLPPRANPDLIGHGAVEKALLADFTAGRMPHALILAGLPGIGKATLAFRLARFLLSQGGAEKKEAGLFGEEAAPVESLYLSPLDPVFRRVAASGHADLMTVERVFDEKKGRYQSDIPVESVRKIHPFLRMTSAEGGWRVVIVDGGEYLNHNGQNALLKILEEPPKKTILIITTSLPGAFLPTIRSRCRMIHLEPLEAPSMRVLTQKYLPRLPATEETALLDYAAGSIGRAIHFFEAGGIALSRDLGVIMKNAAAADMAKLYDLADKCGKTGAEENFALAFDIMKSWCQKEIKATALAGERPLFLETFDMLRQIEYRTEAQNLDKKAALMSAFLSFNLERKSGWTLSAA